MIPARHEWTSHAEAYDYAAMAQEAAERVKVLEDWIKKVKAEPVSGMQEIIRQNVRIMTLEEELMEQRSLYDLFCRKAKERRQV